MPSLFHMHNSAAVSRPVSIFGCERSHNIFRVVCASSEKRGTPASIISTITQVKNQTFSFHFSSSLQQCVLVQSVGTLKLGGGEVLDSV